MVYSFTPSYHQQHHCSTVWMVGLAGLHSLCFSITWQLILETPLEQRQGESEDTDETAGGFFSEIIVPPSLLDKFDKLKQGIK